MVDCFVSSQSQIAGICVLTARLAPLVVGQRFASAVPMLRLTLVVTFRQRSSPMRAPRWAGRCCSAGVGCDRLQGISTLRRLGILALRLSLYVLEGVVAVASLLASRRARDARLLSITPVTGERAGTADWLWQCTD